MPHKDPVARAAYNKARRERKIDEIREYDRQRNGTSDRKRARVLHDVARRYRMSAEEYDQLYALGCWLCREGFTVEDREARAVIVEHDHSCCLDTPTCGRCTRGLAHSACNKVIGYVRESPERLERIAESLREHALHKHTVE